jgi:hypothetical protein
VLVYDRRVKKVESLQPACTSGRLDEEATSGVRRDLGAASAVEVMVCGPEPDVLEIGT